MKFFAHALLSFVLIIGSIAASAQDSTKRTPAQRPPAATVKPAVQPEIPAKKVVTAPARPSLWTQLQAAKDSLRSEHAKVVQAHSQLALQADTIQQLQDTLKAKAEVPKETPEEARNQVNVLGSNVDFSTYNSILLGALLLFILAFVFVVVRSAKYRQEAHYRTNLFQELSDEFHAHKVKANEKEKKLARELQDERNKIEEMKGR
ncbi:MAG: ribosomal protein [Sphingobacteriaceae bacterium]|jgi:hypothetical protein|nr:ribosomal protein [Sphingobacteriaceae bacterium]